MLATFAMAQNVSSFCHARFHEMQRRLTPEEVELWRKVTATVRPRKPVPPFPQAVAQKPIPEHRDPMPPARPPAAVAALPHRAPQPLDMRTLRDLRRERMTIDARIDLHGMRAAEAHAALNEFLRRAQRSGARMVLVVTGKGSSPGADPFAERGVLRRHTPMWLADGALGSVVSGFSQASDAHGGAGALYVRLRRKEPTHHVR